MITELMHPHVHVSTDFMKILIEYVKNVHTNVQNVLVIQFVQFVKMQHIEILQLVIVLMDISMQVKKTVSSVTLNVQLVQILQIIV